MRYAIPALTLLLLAIAGLRAAAEEEQGVVKDDKFNFEIRLPEDSVDWEVMEIDPDIRDVQGLKAHFRTVFADSDPPTHADVFLFVTPISKDLSRYNLQKIAKKWEGGLEEHLDNKRDRSEAACKLGTVEAWKVDVQGDKDAGVHRRTWTIAKNGAYIYTLIVDRNYKAVTDEYLEEEVRAIHDSLKFMRIEKPVTHKEGGKKGDAPGADAGGPGKKQVEIDPELLKKETFHEPFWRFKCVKPEGLVKKKLEEVEAKNDTKYKFMNDKDGSRCLIRIYAQTEKAKKWTIDKLLQHKLDYFEKEVKQKKEPKLDKKAKFPMAKKAIRVELVGRAKTTIRRIWILAECKNDRQYQLEIFLTGSNGMAVWGKKIDEFIKNFKPTKR